MKADSVNIVHARILTPNFRSNKDLVNIPQSHDSLELSNHSKKNKNTKAWLIAIGIAIAGAGAIIAHKSGLFGKAVKKTEANISKTVIDFKNIEEAKKYFEELGIETDLRGATNENLGMLNRIKDNLKQLKDMGVKKDKPDALIVSDWQNKEETIELFRKYGSKREKAPDSDYYYAFSLFGNNKGNVIINSNIKTFKRFLHEMGHIGQHRGLDSYWHSKGLQGADFADNQLKILGSKEKIFRTGRVIGTSGRNIIEVGLEEAPSRFTFPTNSMETRYVDVKKMIDVMQKETQAYDGGKTLTEQIAYVFEGMLEGKKFSDEVMLYYDFAGGTRIPNLKIGEKAYDEYIESLYNNKDLIAKLRENVIISKL